MLKALADWLPLLLFFGVYVVSGEIKLAVGALMVAMPIAAGALLLRKSPHAKVHVWSTALVLAFGALTLWLDDPLFIKLKPTTLYLGLAAVVVGGILLRHNLVAKLLSQALPQVPQASWTGIALLWASFLVVLALLNLYVAFNYSEAQWVAFKTFALPLLTLVFMFGHCSWLIYQHRNDDGSS